MTDPLAALDTPPRVVLSDGEIVLLGERVSVAYTPAAARRLADALHLVLGELGV
jgi:hypothetical protein